MTPGVVRLPVSSPERALTRGVQQPSPIDASPLVKDWQTIIKNIEGDAGTLWKHLVVWKPHRDILTFGTCAFGIEATAVNANADLNFGGHVIGMISTVIEK
ncbi:chitin-binding type 1 [Fusarium pseudoanthophilum]|uniref:Chitin-binding type 1 n=1 Tax=Fusarium pseudoanthophilum TaxID=48495 RepID=A0A8H5NWT0_9HYPO|nr:chitin-binding type 1 [Fusarium pseudoanthophilum]